MAYVYSTLSADVKYNLHETQKTSNSKSIDVPRVIRSILIKGGAGVATKRLDTPLGVVTSVTSEELEILEQNDVFQTHKKNGFIKVEKRKVEEEVVVVDMEGRDESAPLTPNDGLEGDVNNTDSNGKSDKKDRSYRVKNNLA